MEGVIQFRYDLNPPAAADGIPDRLLRELNGVRRVLRALGLIGQEMGRYGGLGFGNLSVRLPGQDGFYISASQTSGRTALEPDDVCRIDAWDVPRFRVAATGRRPPSSEALTHAMIYAADPQAMCVLHVHDPSTWRTADRLGLPATSADAGYGSPAMAESVHTLLSAHLVRPLVFVTPGHEDGVFAVGQDSAHVAGALTVTLVQAWAQT